MAVEVADGLEEAFVDAIAGVLVGGPADELADEVDGAEDWEISGYCRLVGQVAVVEPVGWFATGQVELVEISTEYAESVLAEAPAAGHAGRIGRTDS